MSWSYNPDEQKDVTTKLINKKEYSIEQDIFHSVFLGDM